MWVWCLCLQPVDVFFFFFFKQKTAYEIMPSLVGSEMCIRDRNLPFSQPFCLQFVFYSWYFYFIFPTKKRQNNEQSKISSREFLFAAHHQISFNEIVYLTVHYTINVGCLVVGAMIFYSSVVEDITSDL
eukprot:TRINITY_DN15097_c0_g1_i2.p2 TRINITY_DN15097_c0_g1~~TRINITY_DN15097_c0_g1_i2.p2  ORF type:complete len:129 (+),score=8.07 TRINITY_DN15097_c0_g1_i2:3-389(+)